MKAPNTRIVQAENQPDELPEKPLAPAGSGPHDPGMEARMVAVETGLKNVGFNLVELDGKVDRLDSRVRGVEVKVDRLDTRLTGVETRLTSLEGKVDGLDTRLRSVETAVAAVAGKLDVLVDKIPSWWQPPVSAAGLLALLMAGIAAAHYLKILS